MNKSIIAHRKKVFVVPDEKKFQLGVSEAHIDALPGQKKFLMMNLKLKEGSS